MNSVMEALEQFAVNLFVVGVKPGTIELKLPQQAMERLDLEFAVMQKFGDLSPAKLDQYWTNSGFLFTFKRTA